MKGLEKMKKDDLLNLLKKDEVVIKKDEVVIKKDNRTINQLKRKKLRSLFIFVLIFP
jgi:uncharacterized membrane protein